MKTFYDGEEREILSIKFSYTHTGRKSVWVVTYKRGVSFGQIQILATDELDAMRKFPAELERLSKNHEE